MASQKKTVQFDLFKAYYLKKNKVKMEANKSAYMT